MVNNIEDGLTRIDKNDEFVVRILYRKCGIIGFTKYGVEDPGAQCAFVRTGTFLCERLSEEIRNLC